jgi:Domain of unknown function (DUF4349)
MSRVLFVSILLAAAVGCDDKKASPRAAITAGAAGAARQDKEPKGGPPAADPAIPPERKIIYTARVELQVANLDDARSQLDALLVETKGYVAKSDEVGRAGGIRAGTWKVRVPVARFQDFLTRVKTFGELVNQSADVQDVTEEFVDTEARLKNLKSEEAVLNKLLQEKAQSTADLLAFRQQISGVREQIERYQARLDTLSRLTALTTIDVIMREDKKYVPESAPSFGTSAGRTFGDSVGALESLGKGLVLAVIAVAPWLPIVLIGLLLVRWTVRRSMARARDTSQSRSRPTPPGLPRSGE